MGQGVLAVNQSRDFGGETFLGDALLGRRGAEPGDFLQAQEGEQLQEAGGVAVVGVDPILIKAIWTGFCGVEPDGVAGALAEFFAGGGGEQRKGDAEGLLAANPADQLNAGGDVSPLIAAAALDIAAVAV